MPNARRSIFVAAQWLFAAAIVWFAVHALRGQWVNAGERLATLRPQWSWIALATVIVFLTYWLLIETWRRIIEASGETLPPGDAARIWFVSNLGKYVPGKVWSIAAMTVMAKNRQVSPVVAAGSSVLTQLVTIAAGIGVALVAGAGTLDRPVVAIAAAALIVVGLIAAPSVLPMLGRAVSSLTGKEIVLPRMSARSVWLAVGSAVISWVAYGIAFQLFVKGVLGSSSGATSSYIAVYAASYIIGFLALFAPGGAVVRESAMVTGMVRLGLTGQADALAVAIASRLWLTVTELLPGLFYLAAGKRAPRV
ncbi:MAG: lysylphosphatidylglycerol synthase domain-containing protein [Gemmatimonadales bacterium]